MTYYIDIEGHEIDIEGHEVEVPKWARFVAQDYNGQWYFYKSSPTIHPIIPVWLNNGPSISQRINLQVKDWKSQLYEIVRK